MQWEYQMVVMGADPPGFAGAGSGKFDAAQLCQHMNGLGRQGWELVSALDTNRIRGATQDIVLIFKRPLPEKG